MFRGAGQCAYGERGRVVMCFEWCSRGEYSVQRDAFTRGRAVGRLRVRFVAVGSQTGGRRAGGGRRGGAPGSRGGHISSDRRASAR